MQVLGWRKLTQPSVIPVSVVILDDSDNPHSNTGISTAFAGVLTGGIDTTLRHPGFDSIPSHSNIPEPEYRDLYRLAGVVTGGIDTTVRHPGFGNIPSHSNISKSNTGICYAEVPQSKNVRFLNRISTICKF